MRGLLLSLVILAVCFAQDPPTNFTATTATWMQVIGGVTRQYNISMSYAGLNSLMAIVYNFESGTRITEIYDYNNHQIQQICTSCSTSYTSDQAFRFYLPTGGYTYVKDETINSVVCSTYNVAQPGGFSGTISFVKTSKLIAKAVLTSANATHTFVFSGVTSGVQASAFVPTKTCSSLVCTKVLDIMLVLDESGSIDDEEWTNVIAFANQVVSSFSIGAGKVNMGVVTFSSAATTQITLSANEQAIRAALSNINRTYLETNLGDGLTLAQTLLDQGRTAPKAMILITDGNPYLGNGINAVDPAKNAAAASKQKGTIIYAIGVGDQINYDILNAVATSNSSDTTYIAKVSDFGSLTSIQNTLVETICQGGGSVTQCPYTCAATGFCTTCDGNPKCICTKNCSSSAYTMPDQCLNGTCSVYGECSSTKIPPPTCCALTNSSCNNKGSPNMTVCAVNSTVPCNCGADYCVNGKQDYQCLCSNCNGYWGNTGSTATPCTKCNYNLCTRGGSAAANCSGCVNCNACSNSGTPSSDTCKCTGCASPWVVDSTTGDCTSCSRTSSYCGGKGTVQADCATCSCNYPWSGANCNTCNIQCGPYGTPNLSNCTCTCQGFYSGTNCTTCTNKCKNGGTVSNPTTQCNACNCVAPWTVNADCSGCSRTDSYCSNGGKIDNSTCTCKGCSSGYGNADCGTCLNNRTNYCNNRGNVSPSNCTLCVCDDTTTWSGATCNLCQKDRSDCSNHGNIDNTTTCSKCTCDAGYNGTSCNNCYRTRDSFCTGHGNVVDCTSCSCDSSGLWSGANCQTCTRVGTSYCGNGTVSSTDCATCTCNNGWKGSELTNCDRCTNNRTNFCNNRGNVSSSCTTCTCDDTTQWNGNQCQNCARDNSYCNNHGTLDTTSCSACSCSTNWNGTRCDNCYLTDSYCSGKGSIVKSSCSCQCTSPWTGLQCTTCSRATGYCQNGGTIKTDCATCTCSGNWTGSTCTSCSLSSIPNYCGTHGTLNTTTCKCDCKDGWQGAQCESCPSTNNQCKNGATYNQSSCACNCPSTTFYSGILCDTCPTGSDCLLGYLNTKDCTCSCNSYVNKTKGKVCDNCYNTDGFCQGNGKMNLTTCSCDCNGNWVGETCTACTLRCGTGTHINKTSCNCDKDDCDIAALNCTDRQTADANRCECVAKPCDIKCNTNQTVDSVACACVDKPCDIKALNCTSKQTINNVTCSCLDIPCNLSVTACEPKIFNKTTCACDVPPVIKVCNITTLNCNGKVDEVTCSCITDTTSVNINSNGAKKNNTPYIIGAVVAGVILLIAAAALIAFLLLKKKPAPEPTPFEMQNTSDSAKVTGSPIYKDLYSKESPVYTD